MSPPAKPAPFGSWKSPITSDLIVAQSISLSDVRLDGGNIYWLEGRPQEQGRLNTLINESLASAELPKWAQAANLPTPVSSLPVKRRKGGQVTVEKVCGYRD